MAFLVPNVGEQEMLKRVLNGATPDNVKLNLYSNNKTPGEADVIGDYTLITDPAAITLTGSSFDYTTAVGTASYAQQTFTFTGAATVYGYVITNAAGTLLLASELFSDGELLAA
jgi:phage baseplate assembly protein gpV